MTENATIAVIEVWADDFEVVDDLYAELGGVAGITVEAASAPTEPGEQGAALDMLTVALSSGAVTAFLQIIKVLAESRGPKFSLKIRQGKNRLEVTADSVDEVLPVIRELIDGGS